MPVPLRVDVPSLTDPVPRVTQEGELKEIYASAHEFGAYYAYSPESDTFNFTKSEGSFFSPDFPPHVSTRRLSA